MNEEIKQELVELGELVSAETIKKVFEMVRIAIKATPNKFDDMLLPALPIAEMKVLELVDKIDGEVG